MSVSKQENNLIGKRIEKARNMRNLTQSEVSKHLSIKRANYTSTEIRDNSRYFKDYQILELAKLFDVSADYLLGLSDESSTNIKFQSLYKQYGLTKKSLDTIKQSSEHSEETLNYFIENIGLPLLITDIEDYKNISEANDKISFLLFIKYLSNYIIDKLRDNEKDKLKKFLNYCNTNNERIFDILLCFDIDYGTIYEKFTKLYNLVLIENEKFTKEKEKELKSLLGELGLEYGSLSLKLNNILKIKRLDLIERLQHFLDIIRYSNKIEIGTKDFINLFGENEKELEKYLGDNYISNKKYFNDNSFKHTTFI